MKENPAFVQGQNVPYAFTPVPRHDRRASGFTIIEVVVVLAVISILISMMFSVRGFQVEARKIVAQSDLRVLKIALESYYKNYGNKYPDVGPNWEDTLVSTKPAIIDSALYDPFTPSNNIQFGYALSPDSSYYVIYSVGPKGTGISSIVDTGKVTVSNEAIWDSNGSL